MFNICRKSVISCRTCLSRSVNPASGVASTYARSRIHTTSRCEGLEEFFDDKDNWTSTQIRVGRPWLKDELRLKSNSDLHKLWYVLLKERNMVMTMLEAYARDGETAPSPERIEKVEESMENLLDVVAERDRAVNLLETGETGEPGRRWVVNELGRGVWRRNTEHVEPLHANEGRLQDTQYPRDTKWAIPYKRLYRETVMKREQKRAEKEFRHKSRVFNLLPDEHLYPEGKPNKEGGEDSSS